MKPEELRHRAEERFVDVAGGQIFVKKWSLVSDKSASATPVILFHDSLGCVDLWKGFPALLCEKLNRPVIAYDRLGFGRSSARTELPSNYFIEEEAEVFIAIVSAFEISKCDLFGHSVGGAMAIACAARHKEVCRSVITESTQAFVEDKTLQGIRSAEESFKEIQNFERLKKYHGEKTNWVLKAWIDVWSSQAFRSWTLAPQLEQVTAPVMAIHGDQDEYGSVKFPEMISTLSRGPSEMYILSNCGHVPHREQPDKVLTLVADFLKS